MTSRSATRHLSVVGLGKLGAPMVACFASKGFHVTGVDVNPTFVAKIHAGEAPVYEPGLAERLHSHRSRISATQNFDAAVAETEATFIIVPTPSDAQGWFSLDYALAACRSVGAALKNKKDYHLVVMTSTVMPGATAGTIRETLERESGKKMGEDFGLCYSPEFIALGSVIRDFLNPDFVLLGECDSKAGNHLEEIYRLTCENHPPIARMNLTNAEITKISVNTYVTMKITYANLLARICEQIPDSDADIVAAAVGKDSRIGTKYLKGALGYGGPCFPRDNKAFGRLAQRFGVPSQLAETTDILNRAQAPLICDLLEKEMKRLPSVEKKKVAVLGLSYKPHTDVVEESQSLEIAKVLSQRGYSVSAFDPAAGERAKAVLGANIEISENLEQCLLNCTAVVLATPWPEFKDLPWSFLQAREGVILDCWRMFDEKKLAEKTPFKWLGLGKGM